MSETVQTEFHRWKRVQGNRDRETDRMKVQGGWIYLITELGDLGSILKQTAVYVPTLYKMPET